MPRSRSGAIRRRVCTAILAALLLVLAAIVALAAVGGGRRMQTFKLRQPGDSGSGQTLQGGLVVSEPKELGIQHLRIPGQIRETGEVVLLHLWLRRRQQAGGQASFTGFGFMEVLSYTWTYAAIILLQPEKVTNLAREGALHLHEAASGTLIANFSVTMDVIEENDRHQLGRPFWVSADLPAPPQHHGQDSYDVKVLDWNRFARYTPSGMQMGQGAEALAEVAASSAYARPGWFLGSDCPAPPLDKPSPNLIFVLQPFLEVDITQSLALLVGHISWHRYAMGLAGYLVYVMPQHFQEFAADAYLVALQQEGFLQLVLWDQEISEIVVPDLGLAPKRWSQNTSNFDNNAERLCYVHQALVYNHALLLTIGKNVTLLIGDLDEFLTTPAPKQAPQIVRECLAENATSSILYWRDTKCGECEGAEINAWVAARKASDGSGIPLEQHPLRQYWVKIGERTSYGKSLVVPDRTHLYRHHEGRAHSGGRHVSNMGQCDAELLHAKSLFMLRDEGVAVQNVSAWQWPFHASTH